MNDASGELPVDCCEGVASASLEEDWGAQEVQRHQQEAERWQRRVELAERHLEFNLATEAAQRARRHAGLALAALKATSQATASGRRRGWTD